MNVLSTHRTLHPMQWAALIAVTLFALTGIGAITGLIPVAKSQTDAQGSGQAVVATSVAAAPVPDNVQAPLPAAPASAKKVHEPVAAQHHVTIARNDPLLPPGGVPPDYKPEPAQACKDCGFIESVRQVAHEGQGSGVGAVAGGVLGGALGNGVGQGNGRVLTTIAGMVGGAMLGNHVEKSQRQTVSYQTTVRFDDGSSRLFSESTMPPWKSGERVHVVDGNIQAE